MRSRIVWILVLLALAAAVWWLLRPQPVAVDTSRVVRGSVRAFVEEEDMTRVVDRFVVSMPVDGRLLRVALEEGDAVGKGQFLATIDPLPLRSRVEGTEAQVRALRQRIVGARRKQPKEEEVEQAKARRQAAEEELAVARSQLEEAQAAHTQARAEAERIRRLVASASATASELDSVEAAETQAAARVRARELQLRVRTFEIETARLQVDILEKQRHDFEWEEADYGAQIDALEASLAALRADLARTEVCAPAAGVVLVLHEESERVLPAGAPVVEIGDVGRLEVEADFLSEDAAHMRVGMPVEVFGRGLGERVLETRIARIDASAFREISTLGVEEQRVTVVCALDAVPEGMQDRYRVEVRVILEGKEGVLLVPEGALFRHAEAWHVFVLEGGKARLRPVETGLRNGIVREILGGLAEGDEVVLHPDASLEDGTAVEPIAGGVP